MYKITSITNKPKQTFRVSLDTGDQVEMALYFLPTQYSWYYDFTYKSYTSNGNKVVLSPNSIRNLRHILPFGIAFIASGVVEPYSLDDFYTDRVSMYVLNADEVQQIEEAVFND